MKYRFDIRIKLTQKDLKRFLRLKGFNQEGVYLKEFNGSEENQRDEEFFDRLVQTGLMGFSVVSWGMQEHTYFLTDFGKEVRKIYTHEFS